MDLTRRSFNALAAGAAWLPALTARGAIPRRPVQVVATGLQAWPGRGGLRAALEAAVSGGADMLATGVAPTRDGLLAAVPDIEISAFTNIADRADLASRRRTVTLDGATRSGWFVQDFTLAELKSLSPPGPRRRDDAAPALLGLDDVISLARAACVRTARVVGVQASLLHPGWYASLETPVEPLLATAIRVDGYNARAAAFIVDASEPAALQSLGELSRVRRVLRAGGLVDAAAMAALKGRVDGVALAAEAVVDISQPKLLAATPVVAAAHAAGLTVQVWTNGATFPPAPLRSGDSRRVLAAVLAAGVDALAGDSASPLSRARDDAAGPARD